MPSYCSFIWRDKAISVSPTWLRKTIQFWPYRTSDEIRLWLDTGLADKGTRYIWELKRFAGDNEPIVKSGGGYITSNHQQIFIEKFFIPGQHNLIIQLIDEQAKHHSERRVLASFELVTKDSFSIRMLVILLSVIATGIFAVLIKLLFG